MRAVIGIFACLLICLTVVSAPPFARAEEPPSGTPSRPAKAPAGDDASEATPATPRASKGIDFFESKIRPVLVKHCYECHSAESKEVKGGLLLDTRIGIRRGGDSGPAVVPGNLDESLILGAIKYETYEMPPSGPLSEAVVADFERWIKIGAPDPRSGGRVKPADPKDTAVLWSIEPVTSPAVPEVKDAAWPRSEIDRFILARLEAADLRPAPDASREQLIRRIYFDLIGMPPAPAAIEAFVVDDSPDALARVVDELLASPQFGERWGRHWLDVARFAESNGKDRDVLFPFAWRYRDWVIDAINAGMPYDRFITEQLAGDILAADVKDTAERDRLRIATGILAIGPKTLSGGGSRLEMDMIDDQIDVVSRAVLGLTVSCARCHDHKFDPIPTRDYYALAGIFGSTDTLFGGNTRRPKNDAERAKELITIGTAADMPSKEREALDKKVAAMSKEAAEARANHSKIQQRNAKIRADGEVPTKEQIEQRQSAEDVANRLAAELEELKKQQVSPEFAMAVRESARIQNCKIHLRGEIGSYGDEVPRGFLSQVPVQSVSEIPGNQSGRLQLARWVTDPSNPLTARVAVNRIWHHLFGEGIVRTVENFGRNGEGPSHPELLDWLATRFVEEGWSTRQMIRQIVLSRTYAMSTQFNEDAYAVDPDNRLRWRASKRRLDVEAMRDSLLAASGKLDLHRPAGSRVTQAGEGEVGRGINTEPLTSEFNHRSVYLPIIRGLLPEILKVFDFAEPSIVVGRRDVTTVPAQALYFMNSPLVIQQAAGTAWRVLGQSDVDDAGRVRQAYLLCIQRAPSDAELKLSLDYLARTEPLFAADKSRKRDARLDAWTSLCQALFASAEFRYLE